MNHVGRFALLASSIGLILIGVVCLRHRIGPTIAPPAFLPGGDVSTTNSGGTRPTIVTADPSTELTHPTSSSWRDPAPIPISDPDPIRAPAFQPQEPPPFHGSGLAEPLTPHVSPPPIDFIPRTPHAGEAAVEVKVDSTLARENPVPVMMRPAAERPLENVPVEPTTEVAPAIPRFTVVVTMRDDSLWSISERIYGNGLYYQALYALNRDRIPRPDRMIAGIEVLTPPPEELRILYPKLCPEAPRTSRLEGN